MAEVGEGLGVVLRRGSWDMPPVFPWLQTLGSIDDDEMFRVFNMGVGMTMIVAEYYAESIVRHINQEAKIPAWIIGDVVPGNREVEWA